MCNPKTETRLQVEVKAHPTVLALCVSANIVLRSEAVLMPWHPRVEAVGRRDGVEMLVPDHLGAEACRKLLDLLSDVTEEGIGRPSTL